MPSHAVGDDGQRHATPFGVWEYSDTVLLLLAITNML
jgi:hypothetical protein